MKKTGGLVIALAIALLCFSGCGHKDSEVELTLEEQTLNNSFTYGLDESSEPPGEIQPSAQVQNEDVQSSEQNEDVQSSEQNENVQSSEQNKNVETVIPIQLNGSEYKIGLRNSVDLSKVEASLVYKSHNQLGVYTIFSLYATKEKEPTDICYQVAFYHKRQLDALKELTNLEPQQLGNTNIYILEDSLMPETLSNSAYDVYAQFENIGTEMFVVL